VPDELPPDLAEVIARRTATLDESRPQAVERRHRAGGRTARENVDDLVGPGSFVECGRFAVAAQRARREVQDLIERTPADGLVAGTARVNGHLFGDGSLRGPRLRLHRAGRNSRGARPHARRIACSS